MKQSIKQSSEYFYLVFSILSLVTVLSYKAYADFSYSGNGGILRTDGTYSIGGGCYAGNPYTGNCTCPAGYTAAIVTAHDNWAVFQCYQ